LTLQEEEEMEAKNAELGSFLDRIGGAIHSQTVNILSDKVRLYAPQQNIAIMFPLAMVLKAGRCQAPCSCGKGFCKSCFLHESANLIDHVMAFVLQPAPGSAGPAMDLSAGRLPPHALKELFELQEAAAGKAPDADYLIQK
jgi:hypothetical protein